MKWKVVENSNILIKHKYATSTLYLSTTTLSDIPSLEMEGEDVKLEPAAKSSNFSRIKQTFM